MWLVLTTIIIFLDSLLTVLEMSGRMKFDTDRISGGSRTGKGKFVKNVGDCIRGLGWTFYFAHHV